MKKLVVGGGAVLLAATALIAVIDDPGVASPRVAATARPSQPDLIDLSLTFHTSGVTSSTHLTLAASSYSFDAARKTPSGRESFSPISVTIPQGSQSPALASLLANNRIIEVAELAISSEPDGQTQTGYYTQTEFRFKDAVITGIHSTGRTSELNSDTANTTTAQQVLTIDYESMTQSYTAPPPS